MCYLYCRGFSLWSGLSKPMTSSVWWSCFVVEFRGIIFLCCHAPSYDVRGPIWSGYVPFYSERMIARITPLVDVPIGSHNLEASKLRICGKIAKMPKCLKTPGLLNQRLVHWTIILQNDPSTKLRWLGFPNWIVDNSNSDFNLFGRRFRYKSHSKAMIESTIMILI